MTDGAVAAACWAARSVHGRLWLPTAGPELVLGCFTRVWLVYRLWRVPPVCGPLGLSEAVFSVLWRFSQ